MLNPLDAFGPATNCLSLFTASMGESAKRSPCIAPYQDSSVEFCTSSVASVTGPTACSYRSWSVTGMRGCFAQFLKESPKAAFASACVSVRLGTLCCSSFRLAVKC